ncbi:MAG: cytochrome bc complex cytochrome b subunit [Nocardioides sp.]|nr:cytochrome bc complex cytochrome b subunit [Nocardioides sp.]
MSTESVATTNGKTAATAKKQGKGAKVVGWADDRLGLATVAKKNIRKIFPDHWSFMLGEIALWSFVVLLITGVFLTFWFKPSMGEIQYMGSYEQLKGVHMSEAMASTLDISFDVRGGLLMRQMHHWAAMLFIAAMLVHMARVFLTGAFRKPREVNWLIGGLLILLGIVEGFAGYSLPDDLLSGTGLRIAQGMMQATPVVGTYMSFFLFGGEFPGEIIIPRLYMIHILLVPALILALIGAHMLLLVYHKHTQWPGPGRTEENVVGFPMLPVYAAKAGGFFFIVFGMTALMGALMTINPVWKYGPYNPSQVTAGSQPDWYMGIAEGMLRIMPGWETHLWGLTLSWNVFIPGLMMPVVLLGLVLAWPFLEAWVTGDRREHHLLQRPREAPSRTAFLVAMMTLYGLLWAAGGNDVLAVLFHLNLNHITYFMRIGVFVIPVIVFFFVRRWCISLQRHDNEMLTHGYESGVINRSPEGGYSERHLPLSPDHAYRLTAGDRVKAIEESDAADANGVRGKGNTRRAKLSQALYGHDVDAPTAEEIEDGRRHLEHDLDHDDHHSADGHQYDGRHEVEGESLRGH